jgi:hypothetical protein
MSTLELFATSIVAALLLGAILGAFGLSLLIAAADRKERQRARGLRREIRNITERADRLHWRAQHLGTPYRQETIDKALADLGPDTHNASRKAAGLEVVR